jgi:hypothetical protein
VNDVLDLGELFTTSVEQLAKEAWQAQQYVRMMKNFSFGPEYDTAKVERELRTEAGCATGNLGAPRSC